MYGYITHSHVHGTIQQLVNSKLCYLETACLNIADCTLL